MSDMLLEKLIRQANKKYGEGTIIRGNDYPTLQRVSTGIFALDVEIGGGVPKGRIVIFTGNESTGKTTVSKLTIAQFQRTCRNCMRRMDNLDVGEVCCENPEPHKAFFVDIEGTFDPVWFEALGGDLGSLYLSQPQFSEQAVDIVEAVIRTGDVDIIVVDSIAMMSPAEEVEKSAEDLIVGTHAKLINRMMRSIQAAFNSLGSQNKRKPCVILINQLREKVGIMFGNPTVMPGGKGQKFANSIMVSFSARGSERLYETIGNKEDRKPVGTTLRFVVDKNKTFPPHRRGQFTLYTDDSEEYGVIKGEVDNEIQIVRYGVRFGLITKSGSWFTYKNVKEQGEGAMGRAILENTSLREGLENALIDLILGSGSKQDVQDDDFYEEEEVVKT